MNIRNRYLIVESGRGRNKTYKILDMHTSTLSDETYYRKPVDECAKLNAAEQSVQADEAKRPQKQVIMNIYTQKQLAKSCGCITCNGILHNIHTSLRWFAAAKDSHNKRWARANYHYFIKSLFESNGNPQKHVF